MPDIETTRRIVGDACEELKAILNRLLARVDAEPENGDVRREAYELGSLYSRLASMLINDPEFWEWTLEIFMIRPDLVLLDGYIDESTALPPYRDEASPPEATRRVARLSALRTLLVGYTGERWVREVRGQR